MSVGGAGYAGPWAAPFVGVVPTETPERSEVPKGV